MAIDVGVITGRNWVVTPAAPAEQTWHVVLTGVGIVDLQGDNPHDWRRETLSFDARKMMDDPGTGQINAGGALWDAITRYSVPLPPAQPLFPFLSIDQWALFAGVSSSFNRSDSHFDAGFAVDTWRVDLVAILGFTSNEPPLSEGDIPNIFKAIEVDVAVRNTSSTLHRVSYHVTLSGRIVFAP